MYKLSARQILLIAFISGIFAAGLVVVVIEFVADEIEVVASVEQVVYVRDRGALDGQGVFVPIACRRDQDLGPGGGRGGDLHV